MADKLISHAFIAQKKQTRRYLKACWPTDEARGDRRAFTALNNDSDPIATIERPSAGQTCANKGAKYVAVVQQIGKGIYSF